MSSAPPILWIPIGPADAADRARLLEALTQIAQGDSGVLVRTDPHLLYSGTSLEHLQKTFARIVDEYRIPAWTGKPRIRYIEALRRSAEAEGKYIRQTGGRGNYAHVKLRLEPADPGTGVAFMNAIQGGVIPQQFIAAIESGIREATLGGILAGYEVVDFKATLYDGSFHEVDSNDMAFQIAGSLAFKEAARKARPVILEPIMNVRFTVPEAEQAEVMMEISRRRGQISTVEASAGIAFTRATVPLEELLGYDNPALHIESFAGYREKPSGFAPGDSAGAGVRSPRGPSPKTDSAAANPDWDWT